MSAEAEFIDSPLFGLIQVPDEYDAERLRIMVESSPLAVFQALNKALNARGMRLHIAMLPVDMLPVEVLPVEVST